MPINQLKKELRKYIRPGIGKDRFTKTGEGHYGHGLKFLNLQLNVPKLRELAKKHKDLSNEELKELIYNRYQQYRLIGFFTLVEKYKSKDIVQKNRVLDFYLKNLKALNNWDLVDSTAYQILGSWLIDKKDRSILYKLAQSKNLWERRLAIVSTYAFIRNVDLKDTYQIAEILFQDEQDLIHKAVGWMLREAGKRDEKSLEQFLRKNIRKIPRTALRYAIEKFEETKREKYLEL